jgi:hypothetical protein
MESEKTAAVNAFIEHKAEREAAAELEAYQWSLEEVEAIRHRGLNGTGDTDADMAALERYKALKPFFEASRQRGDYTAREDFTRDEAQAFIEARGITGEVWSIGELNAIMTTPELASDYGAEVNRAQAEGRLWNPNPQETMAGKTHHFMGEHTKAGTPEGEAFKKRLNDKLERVDIHKRARALVNETREHGATLDVEKHGKRTVRGYYEKQLEKIQQLDLPQYPVRDIEGYLGIEATLNELE